MMITGEVIKKPEHIELGKYNVTVRTKAARSLPFRSTARVLMKGWRSV